ncbi:MAG: hypothetical protein HYV07_13150 [Deltaproteobacteria bacterium]|nr:hypothetical protein [Deltaproteobacteria bacterium]
MSEVAQRPRRDLSGLVLGLVIIAASVLVARVAWNRAFQVDEVEHIHTAYSMRAGALVYRDFWEPHNPLLWFLILPVVDVDDPVASFLGARLVALTLFFVCILLTASVTSSLAGRLAGLLAAGFLVVHSTFVERGIEVRPDLGLGLVTVAALRSILSTGDHRRRHIECAMILGVAFLFTQKCAFICVAFGLVWLYRAIRARRWSVVVVPFFVFLLFPAGLVGALALAGNLRGYLDANVFGLVRAATTEKVGFAPDEFLVEESVRNLGFVLTLVVAVAHVISRRLICGLWPGSRLKIALAVVLGLGFLGAGLATDRPVFQVAALLFFLSVVMMRGPASLPNPRLELAASIGAAGLLSLWLNPFPFPYLHVSVLPVLAIVAAGGVTELFRSLWPSISLQRLELSFAGFLVLAASSSAPRIIGKSAPGTEAQFAHLLAVEALTRPEETVYDMVGLYFRPNAYPHVAMTYVTSQRYREGLFPRMIPSWREKKLALFMVSYRMGGLPEEERAFLTQNFVPYAGAIVLPGVDLSGMRSGSVRRFEVLQRRRFRVDGLAAILIDGRAFEGGELVEGVHEITTETPILRARLIVDVPPPPEALLRASRALYVNFD